MLALVAFISLSLVATISSASIPSPSDLQVDGLSGSPVIDHLQPRFSYKVECGDSFEHCERGLSQASQTITVSEVFSGKQVWQATISGNETWATYGGSSLAPHTKYSWSVQWTSSGSGEVSSTAGGNFSVGIVSESDWMGANWVEGPKSNETQLRSEFALKGSMRRVVAYVSAPGGFSFFINGMEVQSVGEDAETVVPSTQYGVMPWLQFDRTVLWQAHDITTLVVDGDNAIGVLLGSGWWTTNFHGSRTVRVAIVTEDTTGAKAAFVSGIQAGKGAPCVDIKEHESDSISCPAGQQIKAVPFASFGVPTGSCSGPPLAHNSSCDAPGVQAAIQAECVGLQGCRLAPACKDGECQVFEGSTKVADPCFMVPKHLSANVTCEPATGPATRSTLEFTATSGFILSDSPYYGTNTDWRRLQAGWDEAGFKPSGGISWSPAVLTTSNRPVGASGALAMPLSRVIGEIPTTNVTKLGTNWVRFNFPVNFVGIIKVEFPNAPPAGSSLYMKHGEVLFPNGSVSFPWDETKQTDWHTFDGKRATITPRFTWHGFQYCEIKATGVSDFDSIKVTGLKIHNALTATGSLDFQGGSSGDDDLLKQIQGITVAGYNSNVAGYMPTDCPTREKHGWLGDAVTSSNGAFYNFNMLPIYRRFMRTVQDTQKSNGDVAPAVPAAGPISEAPGALGKTPRADISWTAAYPVITRRVLQYYGDDTPAREHWDSLVTFMDGLYEEAQNQSCPGGLPNFSQWGDWCPVESRAIATPNTGPVLAAQNYLSSLQAMIEMADAIGKASDAAKYRQRLQQLLPALNANYRNQSTNLFGKTELEVQSVNSAVLSVPGVVSESDTKVLLKGLSDNVAAQNGFLTYGSVGVQHLMWQLSSNGYHDQAVQMMLKRDYPSYGHWIGLGATTAWENWSGFADDTHPPAPTHNHIFLAGASSDWMYRALGGILPASDGFGKVVIQPRVSTSVGPTNATARVTVTRGTVVSSWDSSGSTGAALLLNVLLPVSTEGIVRVPLLGQDAGSAVISEGGSVVWSAGKFTPAPGVEAAKPAGDSIEFATTSGAFSFALHKA